MAGRGKTKNRIYRTKVKCDICNAEVDSDYKKKHADKKHKGLNVTFSIKVDKKQKTLGFNVADCSSSSPTFTLPVHEHGVDLDTMPQLETSVVETPKIYHHF